MTWRRLYCWLATSKCPSYPKGLNLSSSAKLGDTSLIGEQWEKPKWHYCVYACENYDAQLRSWEGEHFRINVISGRVCRLLPWTRCHGRQTVERAGLYCDGTRGLSHHGRYKMIASDVSRQEWRLKTMWSVRKGTCHHGVNGVRSAAVWIW